MTSIYFCNPTAFEKLTGREQLYAHHLARASFYGGLIVLLQTSLESPSIFRLIHRINVAQPIEELREACVGKHGITEVDFKAFMVFCSGIYANMGNYKGFGDTKIVPDLQPETFEVSPDLLVPHYFVQKFNFDITPTFSRVFHSIFFVNFSRENKVVNS